MPLFGEHLEPRLPLAVLVNSGTAADVVYTLPSTANIAYLEDNGVAGDGLVQLRSGDGAFDTTVFANPTGSLTINRGNAADTITINALADFSAGLMIGAAGHEFSTVTFAGPVILAADKSLTAYASGTISLPNSASQLATSGSGPISLSTESTISLGNGSSITSADGAISLLANQQATPTSGNFVGVDVNGAVVQAKGLGVVVVKGSGGTGSGAFSQYGVRVRSGAAIIGGIGGTQLVGAAGGLTPSGSHGVVVDSWGGLSVAANGGVLVQGTGGVGSGSVGVWVGDTGSTITSHGGDVLVVGQGGGAGTFDAGAGVSLNNSAQITAGGNGAVTVQGTGGAGAGIGNDGVDIGTGAAITSSGGNVHVIGQGGGTGASSSNNGVFLSSGQISATRSGAVTVEGTGGAGTGGFNNGLLINSVITSNSGNVQITGVGGGTGASAQNVGVMIEAAVSAGGTGTVVVQGTGGVSSGSGNVGVFLLIDGPAIGSSGGNVLVTGIEGAGTSGTAIVSAAAAITAANGGAITLVGNSMDFVGTSTVVAGAAGTVALRPYTGGIGINLGLATDPIGGPLGIANAELNKITAGTINIGDASTGATTISAAMSRAAGSTTAINLTTGGNNRITFSGTGSLNAKSGNVTLRTDASGAGAITSGSAATDIFAANLSMTAGSGGIGGSGNPLTVSATKLNATTGANANQFLLATAPTTIDATGLSAGTGTIELDGGTFTLGGSDRIDDNTKLNVNGATFDTSTSNETVAGITLTKGSITGATGVLTSASTIQTQSGLISAVLAGAVALAKTGTGTLTLSGFNAYSGATTVSQGTLIVASYKAIPDFSDVTVAAGATLKLVDDVTIGSLNGAGTVTSDPLIIVILTITGGGNFGGSITGNGTRLTVDGSGRTLTLSGANTYGGDTLVIAGTLLVNGSITATDLLSVNEGATLGGTGTIFTWNPVLEIGGHLAPGTTDPGVLTSQAVALNFNPNGGADASFDVALNGTAVGTQYSQQSVTGTVFFGGAALNVKLGFTPAVGDAFTIIHTTDGVSENEMFSGLPEGQVFTATTDTFTGTFQITYRGGADGKDVVLTAVNVNAAPTFAAGANVSVTDESGPQLIASWATGISPGPPGEAAQQVHFVIQANMNPSLFAALPAIDATGNLSFIPAANMSGSAQITIVLQDDGGTADGGSDTSTAQIFTINVAKPHPWHNAARPNDVDSDTVIAPKDALAIINYINSVGSGAVPAGVPVTLYYDASGDNSIAPNDALQVINFINAFGAGEGETPFSGPSAESAMPTCNSAASDRLSADLLRLLALDTAPLNTRRRS